MTEKNSHSVKPPSLVILSQSPWKSEILAILLEAAIKESWINILINLNVAIFFALLLLSTGFEATTVTLSFAALVINLIIASIIIFFLLKNDYLSTVQTKANPLYLLSYDLIVSLGWGLSFLALFILIIESDINILIAYLNLIGIITAVLSAKLASILICSRLIIFLPSLIYLLWQQPANWGLAFGALSVGLLVSFFIGYATHIRILRETALRVQLKKQQNHIIREASFREKFLRSITHDLRQPLNSIRLYTHYLSKEVNHYKEEFRAIRNSIRSGNAIIDSVSQLYSVTDKYPEPKMKKESLDDILLPLISEFKPIAEDQGLSLKYAKNHYSVITEKHYLERIIRNLLQNSMQYTKSGGVLVGVRNRPSEKKVVVQVLDTGCGIDKQDWNNIFLDYHRLDDATLTNAGHLGLGLSIATSIAKAIKTCITVNSQVNKGSCFSIALEKSN